MRVRCIATTVTPRQRDRLGRRAYVDVQTPDLTVGKDYVALGLKFIADFARVRTGAYVWVLADSDAQPEWFDLCLFTVTDPRMSRHWVMRTEGIAQEEVRLWPAQWEAVRERMPHDPTQLAQAHAEAVAELQRIADLLDSEFDDPAVS
jgi:hypothetical protein